MKFYNKLKLYWLGLACLFVILIVLIICAQSAVNSTVSLMIGIGIPVVTALQGWIIQHIYSLKQLHKNTQMMAARSIRRLGELQSCIASYMDNFRAINGKEAPFYEDTKFLLETLSLSIESTVLDWRETLEEDFTKADEYIRIKEQIGDLEVNLSTESESITTRQIAELKRSASHYEKEIPAELLQAYFQYLGPFPGHISLKALDQFSISVAENQGIFLTFQLSDRKLIDFFQLVKNRQVFLRPDAAMHQCWVSVVSLADEDFGVLANPLCEIGIEDKDYAITITELMKKVIGSKLIIPADSTLEYQDGFVILKIDISVEKMHTISKQLLRKIY